MRYNNDNVTISYLEEKDAHAATATVSIGRIYEFHKYWMKRFFVKLIRY